MTDVQVAGRKFAITGNTTISIGLFAGIAAALIWVGVAWGQIQANAEDNDTQDTQIQTLQGIATRGIVTNENINALLERQQRADERTAEALSDHSQAILRLQILIERLDQPGESVGGAPPP